MRRTLVVFTSLVLAGAWLSTAAVAQGQSTHPQGGATLADRLDQFGRKLFQGVLPRTSATPSTQPQTSDARAVPRQWSKGHVVSPSGAPSPGSTPSTKPQQESAGPATTTKPTTTDDAADLPVNPSAPHPASESNARAAAASTEPSTPRLHERLRFFGESAFPAVAAPVSKESGALAAVVPEEKSSPVEARQAHSVPMPAEDTQPPEVARRTLLGRRLGSRAVPSFSRSPVAEANPSAPAPTAATPTVADALPADQPEASQSEPEPAPQPKSVVVQPVADDPPIDHAENVPTDRVEADRAPTDVGQAATAVPPSSQANVPKGAEKPPATDALLFTGQGPILSVKTIGPRRITVGKESTYEVAISNSGRVGADQVVVMIQFPAWAEVSGNEASQGAVTSPPPGAEGAGLRWALGRLEAAAEERLSLRIVPRQSRPFDLAVNWGYTPAGSQTVIEVQEPKLDMRLEGPGEVLFGESQVFRLEVTNSGTGPAENVEISLLPSGTHENAPVTHKLGTVAAGEQKSIEVELTAREAGSLTIQVAARGDAGVEAHLTRQVAVYRPALKIDLEAPGLQYVGTDVTCQIRVSNPGTAPAENVAVTATIPPEVKYVASTQGGKASADGTAVSWTLDRLDVGAERTLAVTCKLARPGASRLKASVSAAGDLTASGEAAIQVEAIADLSLDVIDPSGPIPVGTEATYEVRVQNRGTEGAEEVEVVAYFSEGIEPTAVEGGRHETGPGQVLFDTIASLGAGHDVTFEIKAKAATPGNHVCRVEVYCKPLGTRLVSEETTYFYGNASAADQGTSPQAAQQDAAGSDQPPRTASQPRRPTVAPLRSK